ncbi:aminopeptidase O isoform X1 [Falco biarmicus]|uniref:aminopeptidase O isoform X1 n=1 Tax=Falco rusticolus TaxID=120794 RepID=UPI0018865BE9|nr:aminopeptidase O isoform X1 [Falco rusticolus]XP_037229312.1 aminopeptidase O isoform X1 [Falco rusticolus]XP_055554768.1 aminopeptidase O isoform X1 [Falco cherrug]XP_055554769.1 aminopeptidase O isoform X1 [Falco cherrug]XP_056180293.1 aminopeptidase O isoform X1 [Falco biarmicus]XP_056180294.1 aminopeptidase O isoform X1 [Falco biarmicus]XP_056180295.1 aminopeptidase O isoform X1 [Falco biarmicus]
METQLEPMKDDLPLMANTSYMLVKHYVLDLDVDFRSKVIEGIIVLFFETGSQYRKTSSTGKEGCRSQFDEACKRRASEPCHIPVPNLSACSSKMECNDFAVCGKHEEDTSDKNGNHSNEEQASGMSSSKDCCDIENHGNKDFLLVLDCCDLSVLKVEEIDVAAVAGIEEFVRSAKLTDSSKELENLRNQIVHELVALPADRWKEQLRYFTCCSQAPGCGELLFTTDTWSLEIRKSGIQTPADFPHAIRIWYKTKPEGRSVTWTTDQSGRPCVYTVGSPINNRALFPCQEPPVALSTWQASVRAAAGFVVLMSGENSAEPVQLREGILSWYYYVTMPMPASTFTIAVGCWQEVKQQSFTAAIQSNIEFSLPSSQADFRWHEEICGHVEYPCRFQDSAARLQAVIPYRVFAPWCLMERCEECLIQLIPRCLSAAYTTLGTHPFSRLDVLIVPSNFSSLGMASPHIIFLSQSVLLGGSHLCGTRLCHEIAHAWFGLAIGAHDWTEEWISEGFATFLEDTFWARAQQLSHGEVKGQQELKALLRWRRLRDEVQNSEEELQVLRPKKESTGELSESGASVVKHGLKAEKIFMQVHYLKGYFLLRFLARAIGEASYLASLRKFVHKFHGRLVLSQDFLCMLLEDIPEQQKSGLTVESIIQNWLDTPGIPKPLQEEGETWQECPLVQQVSAEVTKWMQANQRIRKSGKKKRKQDEVVFQKLLPDQLVLLLEYLLEGKTLCPRVLQCLEKTYQLREQDAEVRHRWCELVVKHKYVSGYGDVEKFLREDQAMGVYLYGELMLNEDVKQQELAHKCFAAAQEHMDTSAAKVVAEMLF